MDTRILDGEKVAEEIKAEAAEETRKLFQENLVPGLATVLVGDDPGSHLYVRMKARTSKELGMHSEIVELPTETTTEELLQVIERLNGAEEIDAILVQLPLPDQIDEARILQAVRPDKDVDGFHPENIGRLVSGNVGLAPCTPMGIMYLLKREGVTLKGAEAVVVGRSNIVGKPTAFLLLHQHATVTLCHSRTRDLAAVCRRADILVAAVGQPALVTRDYLKEGVVIIDVGTNRVESVEEGIRLFWKDSKRIARIQEKGSTLVGDVHPRDPIGVAKALTPVPGGVGPLTIAQLMKSTVTACKMRRGGQ